MGKAFGDSHGKGHEPNRLSRIAPPRRPAALGLIQRRIVRGIHLSRGHRHYPDAGPTKARTGPPLLDHTDCSASDRSLETTTASAAGETAACKAHGHQAARAKA